MQRDILQAIHERSNQLLFSLLAPRQVRQQILLVRLPDVHTFEMDLEFGPRICYVTIRAPASSRNPTQHRRFRAQYFYVGHPSTTDSFRLLRNSSASLSRFCLKTSLRRSISTSSRPRRESCNISAPRSASARVDSASCLRRLRAPPHTGPETLRRARMTFNALQPPCTTYSKSSFTCAYPSVTNSSPQTRSRSASRFLSPTFEFPSLHISCSLARTWHDFQPSSPKTQTMRFVSRISIAFFRSPRDAPSSRCNPPRIRFFLRLESVRRSPLAVRIGAASALSVESASRTAARTLHTRGPSRSGPGSPCSHKPS